MRLVGKLKRLVQKLWLYCFFWLRNRFGGPSILSPSSKVAISLTTFKGRINSVYLTIESLFEQKNAGVKQVILWLSLEEFPQKQIPKTLSRLEKRGLTIEFVEGNLKSYKKLIYFKGCYQQIESIITVDDDVFYPSWWLFRILEKSRQFPGLVVCYRGHFMRRIAPTKMQSYFLSAGASVKSGIPSYSLLPTGIGGVLYPRASLSEYLSRSDLFLELCPDADDIWFKAMTLLTDTKVVRVFEENLNFLEIPNTQHISLFSKNLDLNHNDSKISSVFGYFGLYEKIDLYE